VQISPYSLHSLPTPINPPSQGLEGQEGRKGRDKSKGRRWGWRQKEKVRRNCGDGILEQRLKKINTTKG